MASPTDTLSSPPAPNRVYYSLGRMLGVEDFQADQDYHRGRLARALLQLCGTGTVSGLNVSIPQVWQANTFYAAYSFVFDSNQNVQVNTNTAGTSGATVKFATAPGGTVNDGANIIWTNEGQINANGWRPNTPFTVPSAIIDSNNNVQVLTSTGTFTTGSAAPIWNTGIGSTTADGGNPNAWTCVGPAQLEIEVTPGLAIDRVGRMIEVPRTVCIRIQPWLANQTISDLTSAMAAAGGNDIFVDVFATFIPCTRGVTPCFATQDDYDATDAFSPDRLLDSFAMQLVLRTDGNPKTPQDPWLGVGPVPTTAITPTTIQMLQQNILSANSGPAASGPFATNGPTPTEDPLSVDPSSVYLARITIPAMAGSPGQPPNFNLNNISIDNFSRLFVYPPSLVARTLGFSSGKES
ncbi:MAG TPA: hypothetical protein VLW06_04520 [Terriglobales bacterium]|nr:hypothetical protein [Terriglobales bacterium]